MNSEQVQPPSDLETLRSAINTKHALFPKRLAQVARHVLDNPDEVALGSVASIAAAAQVTPSTLIRFAQFLGYDGFSTLQAIFRDAVRAKIAPSQSVGHRQPGREGVAREAQVFYETIEACHHSLETLSKTIRVADIKAAAEILSSAKCVFILTQSGTFPMAALLQHCLTRLKIRSTLLTDIIGGDDVLAFATPDDAAVIISCAPYAEETMVHASTLSGRGVPVVALMDSNFSPLSELASVRFRVIESGHDGLLLATAGIALSEALAICTRQTRQNAANTI
ncbi:MurR/RpiR family transcriptional regulator [Neorhizobium alkalisoli]|uniref:MurR/RpiR family transcriptional regulator n=1 Tax=Neorhizobium alkalisoli TaxID=528178 RepID=UPI000CF9B5C2|nr:MurR/RpiR family transcriptional regulator [Neorhizobium alkalisoli]